MPTRGERGEEFALGGGNGSVDSRKRIAGSLLNPPAGQVLGIAEAPRAAEVILGVARGVDRQAVRADLLVALSAATVDLSAAFADCRAKLLLADLVGTKTGAALRTVAACRATDPAGTLPLAIRQRDEVAMTTRLARRIVLLRSAPPARGEATPRGRLLLSCLRAKGEQREQRRGQRPAQQCSARWHLGEISDLPIKPLRIHIDPFMTRTRQRGGQSARCPFHSSRTSIVAHYLSSLPPVKHLEPGAVPCTTSPRAEEARVAHEREDD
jgi:hypothetical protein